jgi:adenylate cyclase
MGDPRIEAIAEWLIEGARLAPRSEDVLAESHALRRNAANLLDSYVGHQSGERILAGHIERGDCEELDAAIWLSDMRGFTTLADNLPPPTLLALLFTPPRISAASPCPCWSPRCG